MKRFAIVVSIAMLLFAATTIYLLLKGSPSATAAEHNTVFMDSYLVFEEFEMKKDYDKRLEMELGMEQASLDSLGAQLNAATDPLKVAALKKDFTVKKLAFDEKFQALSRQYTDEVYKRLNGYIQAYGKEKHYKLILGSNGDGNVMYVDTTLNVTKDLISYINQQYTE